MQSTPNEEEDLRSRIQFLRKTAGFSWSQVGEAIGVSRVTLWKWRKSLGLDKEDFGKKMCYI